MAKKIQVKRGNAANLPTLAPGELGLTVDTKKIYVGHEQGNVPLAMERELYNPNLLDNADFRNPINQRGLSEYTPSYTYTLDRWVGNDCTVSVGRGYIDITGTGADSKFFQWSENKDIISNGVTLSFNVGGDIYSLTGSTPKTKHFSEFDLHFGYTDDAGFCQISNFYGKTLRVYDAKLEPGTISTILNDPSPNLAVELVKCQRYYEYMPIPRFVANSSTWLGGVNDFVVTKRIVPTLSVKTGDIITLVDFGVGMIQVVVVNIYCDGNGIQSLELQPNNLVVQGKIYGIIGGIFADANL